jgi:hypothetical protein
MIKSSSLALGATLTLVALAPRVAIAAGPGGTSPRAWVSAAGSDVAGCGTVTAPCRTFQYAHDSVVSPGGTIYVQDAGNYATAVPFTISHAISIINDGVGAATIVAPGADGIDVQAGSNDAVFIYGLTLDGASSGSNGINLTSGGSLTVSNAKVTGFSSSGIVVQPSSGTTTFTLSSSLIFKNGVNGVNISPRSTGSVTASLSHVEVYNNGGNGVNVTGRNTQATTTSALISDSVISFNSSDAISDDGVGVSYSVTRTVGTGNFDGIGCYNGPTGVANAYTYGDNRFKGNRRSDVNCPTTGATGN